MKLYNTMLNVGKAKYLVNFHDGVKTHSDGSMFFDIRTFKNKKEFESFQKELKISGYVVGDSSFRITEDNVHIYYEFMSDEDLIKNRIIVSDVLESRKDSISTYFKDNVSLVGKGFFFGVVDADISKIIKLDIVWGSYLLKQTIFGVKDTLKPIDEYIAEIRESSGYKEYVVSNNKQAYEFCFNLVNKQDWSYLDARLETVVKFNIDEQLLNIMFDRAEYNREYIYLLNNYSGYGHEFSA